MTANQFEKEGKSYVFEHIMNKTHLSDAERLKEAEEKLKEIVNKQVSEINAAKVDAYLDEVKLG